MSNIKNQMLAIRKTNLSSFHSRSCDRGRRRTTEPATSRPEQQARRDRSPAVSHPSRRRNLLHPRRLVREAEVTAAEWISPLMYKAQCEFTFFFFFTSQYKTLHRREWKGRGSFMKPPCITKDTLPVLLSV